MIIIKESKLKETSTTEFFEHNGIHYAIFNNKKMKLEDFLKQAKYDSEKAKVVRAIEKKMKSLNYKGNVDFFIKHVFSSTNPKPDVFIRDGVSGYLKDRESFAVFDDEEIKKNLGK